MKKPQPNAKLSPEARKAIDDMVSAIVNTEEHERASVLAEFLDMVRQECQRDLARTQKRVGHNEAVLAVLGSTKRAKK